MESLPDCVLLMIFSHLTITEIGVALNVCKRWNELCFWEIKRRKTLFIAGSEVQESNDGKFMMSLFNQRDLLSVEFSFAIDLLKIVLQDIRSLALCDTNGFKDENLYLVGKYLPNLKKLWLEEHEVSDESLAALFTYCSNLESLILCAPHITGSCFRFLPPLKQFISSDFNFEEENIETLYERVSPTLKAFGFFFFDSGFESLCQMSKNLQTLRIDCIEITKQDTPAFVTFLKSLHRIEKLFIFDFPLLLTEDLESLPTYLSIKSLFLEFHDKNTDENFALILSKFPNLEKLEFHIHCRESKDLQLFNTLQALLNLSKLRELSIDYNIYADFVTSLLNCQTLRKLQIHIRRHGFLDLWYFLKPFQRKGALLHLDIVKETAETLQGAIVSKPNLIISVTDYVESFWPFIEASFRF
ncbi:hypothetical protein B4U80_13446 [Leptotrombidium deliense]|uniref:F-box domain-containing protein n=1 Tax=Leptotrombidium deliense TaxID=299467 RepID=A0A443S6B8_9ACAR|nr:hypothetical protein B4U80_13446 [Leptotrombidium deliense]